MMANTDKRGLLATVGVGALLILCCAAPALIAAGLLGGLGAWLDNPWVIAAAVVAALVVVWQVWTRHRRGRPGPDDDGGAPGHRKPDEPPSA